MTTSDGFKLIKGFERFLILLGIPLIGANGIQMRELNNNLGELNTTVAILNDRGHSIGMRLDRTEQEIRETIEKLHQLELKCGAKQ